MKNASILLTLGFIAFAYYFYDSANNNTYTLYRNSVLDEKELGSSNLRIHISSFDTNDGEGYNRENCDIAASLFQKQPGVKTKFWCEKGRYKK